MIVNIGIELNVMCLMVSCVVVLVEYGKLFVCEVYLVWVFCVEKFMEIGINGV